MVRCPSNLVGWQVLVVRSSPEDVRRQVEEQNNSNNNNGNNNDNNNDEEQEKYVGPLCIEVGRWKEDNGGNSVDDSSLLTEGQDSLTELSVTPRSRSIEKEEPPKAVAVAKIGARRTLNEDGSVTDSMARRITTDPAQGTYI